MPGTHSRDQKPRRGPHKDEADVGEAEAVGEVPCDIYLEATGEDHLAVTDHAGLPYGVGEIESDDELRGTRRNDGSGRRVVGATLGREPQGNEHACGHRSAADEPGDDAESSRQRGDRRASAHAMAASSKTSTGVPLSAKPNSMTAS